MENNKHYKTLLKDIKLFIINIDRTLTKGDITLFKKQRCITVNSLDCYAISECEKAEIPIIITYPNNYNKKTIKRLTSFLKLSSTKPLHKVQIKKIIEKYQINTENICYIGSEIWDIPIIEQVGLGVCMQDAVAEVKKASNYVSHKKSGEGGIRDIILQVLTIK